MATKTPPFIDVRIRQEHLKEDIQALLYMLRPDWQDKELKHEGFHEGFVNTVQCWHLADDCNRKQALVVRVFAEVNNPWISRDREVMYTQLAHAAGVFPPIEGLFQNGLIYRYAPGRTLDVDDVVKDDIIRMLAEMAARLNNLDTNSVPLVNCRGNVAHLSKNGSEFTQILKAYWEHRPQKLTSSERDKRYQAYLAELGDINHLMEWVFGLVEDMEPDYGIIHRDLHPGNVVYDATSGTAMLVDYEMCTQGWKLYDLVTQFQVTVYMQRAKKKKIPQPLHNPANRDLFLRSYLAACSGTEGKPVTEDEIKLVHVQMEALEIVYHFAMMLTSFTFLEARLSLEPLDFLEVGKDMFLSRKDELPRLRDAYRRLRGNRTT